MKALPVAKLSPEPLGSHDPIITACPPGILHLRNRIGEKMLRALIKAAAAYERVSATFLRVGSVDRNDGITFKISENLVHDKPQIGFR